MPGDDAVVQKKVSEQEAKEAYLKAMKIVLQDNKNKSKGRTELLKIALQHPKEYGALAALELAHESEDTADKDRYKVIIWKKSPLIGTFANLITILDKLQSNKFTVVSENDEQMLKLLIDFHIAKFLFTNESHEKNLQEKLSVFDNFIDTRVLILEEVIQHFKNKLAGLQEIDEINKTYINQFQKNINAQEALLQVYKKRKSAWDCLAQLEELIFKKDIKPDLISKAENIVELKIEQTRKSLNNNLFQPKAEREVANASQAPSSAKVIKLIYV